MPHVPKLKLTYFQGTGRGEPIRLAFHIGGIPFIDERLSLQQVAQRKPTLVFGQLPVLEVDGVELAQSQAILRFAGKMTGLYPVNDPIAAMQVDEIIGAHEDFLSQWLPMVFCSDVEKKKGLVAELVATTIPKYLKNTEARLVEMKKSLLFQDPNAIFIHELIIALRIEQWQAGVVADFPTNIADKFTECMAITSKVGLHPKVREWRATHPLPAAPLELKLKYFPGIGRGEPIRLALALADLPFEDIRMERTAFEAARDQFPFGQLPVLEVDGRNFAQSLAILRYVGTLGGLYPVNDPLKALRIDELVMIYDDFFAAVVPVFRAEYADDSTKNAALKNLVDNVLPTKILELLDKRIAFWNAPFAVSETITIADLVVHGIVANIKGYATRGLFTMSIDKYEHVARIATQVNNMDKVQAWYAKQQQ